MLTNKAPGLSTCSGFRAAAMVPILAAAVLSGSVATAAVDDTAIQLALPPLVENEDLDNGHHRVWVLFAFHRTTDAHGEVVNYHVGNWVWARQFEAALPLYYRWGDPGHKTLLALPVAISGPHFAVIPPILTAWWHDGSGTRALWVTPLFHRNRAANGELTSLHVLNFITYSQDNVTNWFLLPIAFFASDGNATTGVVMPLYFQSRDWWLALPVAFSAANDRGGHTTWITPLVHWSTDVSGAVRTFHAGLYFQGTDSKPGRDSAWRVLFPIAYAGGGEGWKSFGVIPLVFKGPGWWCAPLGLSGGWRNDDGGWTTWVTPLFHIATNDRGHVTGFHALTWFHHVDGDVVIPVFWSLGEPGHRNIGVIPFYLGGPHYNVIPLGLTTWWHGDRGRTWLWITPLFHRHTDATGKVADWSVLTWFQTGATTVVIPILAAIPLDHVDPKAPGINHHHGVISPVYVQTKHATVIPPLVTARWSAHGRDTTLVAGIAHWTTDAASGRLLHGNALVWFDLKHASAIAPLYWHWQRAGDRERTLMLPVAISHREGASSTTYVLPPLIAEHHGGNLDTSVAWQLVPFTTQYAGADHETNLLWFLFRHERIQGTRTTLVLPLWWSKQPEHQPMSWQILGGMVAKNCNYLTGHSRWYLFGLIPLGRKSSFATLEPTRS